MKTNEDNTLRNQFAPTGLTRKKLRIQRFVGVGFGLMTVAILIPLIAIVIYIFVRARPVLGWEFIVGIPKNGMRAGGIWPAIVGTGYLVVFSCIVSAPMGVLAAVYLNEYAKDNWFSRIVQLAVVNLSGVPSIVYALFGVGAFVIFLGLGKSIMAASLTIAIMTLPVYIVAAKEAMASIPMAFRVASWNLGASKWQTIRTIVLPNSLSGILTGIILDTCRTVGETAPIMFTGAVFFKAVERGDLFPYSPGEQCMALSYHLHTISTQVPGVPEPMLYGTAAVLLGSVLVFNSLGIVVRTYMRHRKKW
jgi:phosphate transport system permease protein